jgi:hypothetical protein
MLNAWNRYEVPIRAPPIPDLVAMALAWYCVRAGDLGAAFLMLAGFDGFLRTGELLSLWISDVGVDASGGLIKLSHTKSGQRHAAFEASTMRSSLVAKMFRIFVSRLPPGTNLNSYIFAGPAYRFYRLFEAGLEWLGVADLGFKPYSLRRGGATAFYRACGSMEMTLERGRWSSARVGRIYINDGLAKAVELQIGGEIWKRIRVKADALRLWISQEVE